MAQHLRDLVVDRVDLVNAPASKGARVMLFKRDDTAAALPAEVEAYLKRDFSADERKTLASSGAAMPDGSFPISNKADLSNAMRAIGRAKDPAKAKAHIRSRAKALGLEGELSDAFKSATPFLIRLAKQVRKDLADGDEQAVSFDEAYAEGEAQELTQAIMDELREMNGALFTALCSIIEDATVTDKQAAIKESLDQFIAAAGDINADGIEKSMVAGVLAASPAGAAGISDKGVTMSAELKKALGLADTATDADVIAAVGKLNATVKKVADLEGDLAVFKMSAAHQDYADAAGMDGDAKKKFAAMSPADREAQMAKKPAKKAADTILKLADGTEVRKSVVGEAVFAVVESQQAQIAKQGEALAKAAEDNAIVVIEKRVTPLRAIGKAADLAKLLRVVEKVDAKAAEAIETIFKACQERLEKSALFKAAGSDGGGVEGGSSFEKINALANELLKKDPKMGMSKARIEVRKANPDLARAEASEERAAAKAALPAQVV